jgi:hypothetical protein
MKECVICRELYDTKKFFYTNVCSSKCDKKKEEIKGRFAPKTFQELLIRLKYINSCQYIKYPKITGIKEIKKFFNNNCTLKEAELFYEGVVS